MAIVYQQSWAAGNSLFSSVIAADGEYIREDDGVDPLYPEMRVAECVEVNGNGRLDFASPSPTNNYQDSGVFFEGFPSFNGAEAFISVRYRPNATSLSLDQLVYAPLFELYGPGYDDRGFLAAYDPGNGGLNILLPVLGGNINVNAAYTFVADVEYTVRACWRCGTVNDPETFGDISSDGYFRLYINDSLVYSAENIALFIDADNLTNFIAGVAFGWAGLLGECDQIELNDEACLPLNVTDPCLCTPPETFDTPPGGTDPGPPPTTLPPVIGTQLLCAGGGLVPTQADVTSPEAWWYS